MVIWRNIYTPGRQVTTTEPTDLPSKLDVRVVPELYRGHPG